MTKIRGIRKSEPEPVILIPTRCVECGAMKGIPAYDYPVCTDCYFRLCDEAGMGNDK